jgi:general secretion pathway protein L
VKQAETLRNEIARSAAGGDVIAAERARTGDALALIAGLTDALPDDTYLTDLSVRDGHLRLSGQSAAAAKLIPALAADTALRNPSFTAPVTRNDTLRIDMFSIQVDAAGAPP